MKPTRGKVGKVSDRPDIPDLSGIESGPPIRGNVPRVQNGYQTSPDIHFQDTHMISPMLNGMGGMIQQGPVIYPGVDTLQCRDVFTHVENCPICSSYFKKDVKFYWLIIGILIVVILLLTKGGK